MTHAGRLVLGFACLGHALFHIIAALFLTLVLVLQPAWGLSYGFLISLWTLGAFLVGLGAPLAGWLGDRLGETRMMIFYFIGIGASSIACGLAEGPSGLQWSLSALGLFGAIYHPVGTAWVVKNVERQGRSIAILGISGSTGIALASLVAAGLNDVAGWRAAFAVPGAVAIGVGLLLLGAYLSGRVVDRDSDVQIQPEPDQRDVRRAFIALMITMTLTSFCYQAFATMLPKWIGREIGITVTAGQGLAGLGAIVTLIYLSGAVGQIAGGALSDRGITKKALYVGGFLLKLSAFAAATQIGGWPVVVAAMAIAFAFDLASMLENLLIAKYTPSARRGLAYGIRHGIAIIAGPLGVHLVAAQFSETDGFVRLLQLLAVVAALIVAAAALLPSERGAPTPRPMPAE